MISHASGQVRELTKDIRAEHQGQCKSRIEAQHAVVDSIASFIHKQPGFRSLLVDRKWLRLRYREQLDKDVALQNVYKQYIKS